MHGLIPLTCASSRIHQTCMSPHHTSKTLVKVGSSWFSLACCRATAWRDSYMLQLCSSRGVERSPPLLLLSAANHNVLPISFATALVLTNFSFNSFNLLVQQKVFQFLFSGFFSDEWLCLVQNWMSAWCGAKEDEGQMKWLGSRGEMAEELGNTGNSFFSSSVLYISLGHNVSLLPSIITRGAGKAKARKQRSREASSTRELGIRSGALHTPGCAVIMLFYDLFELVAGFWKLQLLHKKSTIDIIGCFPIWIPLPSLKYLHGYNRYRWVGFFLCTRNVTGKFQCVNEIFKNKRRGVCSGKNNRYFHWHRGNVKAVGQCGGLRRFPGGTCWNSQKPEFSLCAELSWVFKSVMSKQGIDQNIACIWRNGSYRKRD